MNLNKQAIYLIHLENSKEIIHFQKSIKIIELDYLARTKNDNFIQYSMLTVFLRDVLKRKYQLKMLTVNKIN